MSYWADQTERLRDVNFYFLLKLNLNGSKRSINFESKVDKYTCIKYHDNVRGLFC